MYGVFHYKDFSPFIKIVFTNGFADKDGSLIRAPFVTTFPMEVLNTRIFEEEKGKTTLTLRGMPLNAAEEEQQFFEAMHANMQQGFGATFTQWESYLKTIISQKNKYNSTTFYHRTNLQLASRPCMESHYQQRRNEKMVF